MGVKGRKRYKQVTVRSSTVDGLSQAVTREANLQSLKGWRIQSIGQRFDIYGADPPYKSDGFGVDVLFVRSSHDMRDMLERK